MSRIPIIMDCDPGHDDAIALVLALSSDKLDVRGITSSSGNQTIEKTTYNVRRICELLGKREIPIAQGRKCPILNEGRTAASAHGETGLDGPVLPEPVAELQQESAVEFIAKIVEESKEKITLVPTGPLTNIGIFILSYPHLVPKIERICMMGGSIVSGCSDKGASEFNILVDAYAADIVFTSGIPITMMGLDVTNYSTIEYNTERNQFRELGYVGKFVAELVDFFGGLFHQIGWPGAPIHDACAVAWLIDPTIFESKDLYVEVDLDGENTYASTVADYYNLSGREPNVTVCLKSDREKFVKMLMDACRRYEEVQHE